MRDYNTNGAFTTIKHEKLTPKQREQVKELRRMHIGEHAERSWPFEAEVRVRLAEQAPVAVAKTAAAMLREVMFWEIKHEDRDFWNYRAVKCHRGCDPDPDRNCCWHKMGLSRRNVESARALLVALDLMEFTSGKGLSSGFKNRTHYRVTHTNMLNLLDLLEKSPPVEERDPVREPNGADEHSLYERTNSVCTNAQTLTESTGREDVQSKYLHEGKHDKDYSSLLPRGGGVVPHETEEEPTTVPRVPSAPEYTPPPTYTPSPAPVRDLADLVNEHVASRDKTPLAATDRDTLAEEFDALRERGTPPDDLEAVANRVASMYPACGTSRDVRGIVAYAVRDVEFDKET